MIQDLKNHSSDLVDLCQQFGVNRLDIFGSASVGNFDSQASDLDFLVVFEPMTPSEHADAYFGLLEALKQLFCREVDLVELEAIRNPYFLEAMEETRSNLYAA